VDDHDILRYGLRSLLRRHPGIEVVGEADSVAQAISETRRLHPRVVLMDARLPDGSGIEACREILSLNPEIRVLFFSAYNDDQTVMMTLLAGAAGHVPKDAEVDTLVEAIRKVASGGTVIDHKLRAEVMTLIESESRATRTTHGAEALSPQEDRVMALVVEGKTNKEIAAAMSLSDKTVKNYLSNAFQKLGVGRRAQAASVFDIERLKRAERERLDSLHGRLNVAPPPD
jgi:two-component system, NarL family, response regulator DevR